MTPKVIRNAAEFLFDTNPMKLGEPNLVPWRTTEMESIDPGTHVNYGAIIPPIPNIILITGGISAATNNYWYLFGGVVAQVAATYWTLKAIG